MWVFDATPLIYLAKVDQLEIVSALDGTCYIPDRVYAEVVTTGLEEGYPDARRIEQRVDAGVLEVVSTPDSPLWDRLQHNPRLSDADGAVLACADQFDATAVMDEAAGRTAAAVEDIETKGTAYLVLSCTKNGHLPVAEARETIDAMIEAGWHCAPDLYAKIVKKLDSFDN
ncbi:DUF3368 domain-containing protein [Natrialbaceae archaeon A-arb3/5]